MRKPHPSTHLRDILGSHQQFEKLQEGKGLTITLKARGALLAVFNTLKKKSDQTVLVPSFHCPTVVQPAILAGLKVKFYKINDDLSLDTASIVNQLSDNVAAVLVINYFGFEHDLAGLSKLCQQNNVLVIEDCSHSMMKRNPLELAGGRGDVAVFSFWKNIPSVLGGGLRINNHQFVLNPIKSKTMRFKEQLKLIKEVSEQIIGNFNDNNVVRRTFNFLERLRLKFKKGENLQGVTSTQAPVKQQLYPLVAEYFDCEAPWIVKKLIKNAQLDAIALKVVENYEYMAKKIANIEGVVPLFPELPNTVFPWCFAVRIENRHLYDFRLKALGVSFFTFGETLHSEIFKDGVIDYDALDVVKKLSNSIICLSIHQDINKDDIDFTCDSLRQVVM